MNKNSIKDDELEKVNGGTQKENNDLYRIFGTSDLSVIKDMLLQRGIDAFLNDDPTDNVYVMRDARKQLNHKQLMDLIYKELYHL